MKNQPNLTRREILRAFLGMPAAVVLAACAARQVSEATPTAQLTNNSPTPVPPAPIPAPIDTATSPVATVEASTPISTPADTPVPTAAAQVLPPTPTCGDDDDEPTLAQTEGPYFTPNTPERTSLLEPGLPGTKLVVTGYVLATNCQSIAQALVDFWHCDDSGVYDNAGYRLRGHQFTDDQGRYHLETIVPGVYTGRTRHIHVKVQAPNQPVLTTQLYFPNEPENERDGIFQPELIMDMQAAADGKAGMFNFVLEVS